LQHDLAGTEKESLWNAIERLLCEHLDDPETVDTILAKLKQAAV